MKKILLAMAVLGLAGCSTTNTVPYKASVDNVVIMQQKLEPSGKTVSLGEFNFANGVNESLTCRLMGPIKVEPENMAEYIKKALQEELFMAKAYSPSADTIISGEVKAIKFSSVSPAYWQIALLVASNNGNSYEVETRHDFGTSWDAYSACQNTANAFNGAVQSLIKKVVSEPKFESLLK